MSDKKHLTFNPDCADCKRERAVKDGVRALVGPAQAALIEFDHRLAAKRILYANGGRRVRRLARDAGSWTLNDLTLVGIMLGVRFAPVLTPAKKRAAGRGKGK